MEKEKKLKIIDEGKCITLIIPEDFSFFTVQALKQKAMRYFQNGKRLFIFDLTNTNWIDSYGMAFIAWIVKNSILTNAIVSIISPKKNIFDLFKQTRIAEIVTFWNSIEQAKSQINL